MKLLLKIILFISISKCFSSPQIPDFLIFKGDTIPTYNLLLEKYFDRIEKPDNGELFGLKFRGSSITNCWRGYQAIYSIENNKLYLNDITDCGEIWNKRKIDKKASKKRMIATFGDKVINEKVFIDWYSGDFSIPQEWNELRWDGVFYRIFENETLISIDKGNISKILKIKNYIDEPDKLNRYNKKDALSILYKGLKKNIKWKDLPDDGRYRWEEFEILINKKGEAFAINFEPDTDYRYKKTINNALKELGDWDILKKQGEPIEEKFRFDLEFDFLFKKIEDFNIEFSLKEYKKQKKEIKKRKRKNR